MTKKRIFKPIIDSLPPKKKRVLLSLDVQEYEKLKKLLKDEKVSFSQYVNYQIKQTLSRNDNQL